MRGFLSPIASGACDRYLLRNTRTGAVVASVLTTAFDSASRNRGLLGHTTMPPMTALVIAPTNAIHTWFMRFPIDVLFVDRNGRVVKVRPHLRPWRMTAAIGAYAVIELPSGTLENTGCRADDQLRFEPRQAVS